ncbi:MAG: NADH-quinone oxidoreductase subunit C [Anaerolineaceae bacterium]|nr:NADH-quinone oxidoreductase subunit C [Anaerolineaceae bacterium]
MNEIELIITQMKSLFLHQILEVRFLPLHETVVRIKPTTLRNLVAWLLEHSGFHHLSTITGLDNGQQIELFYHFWNGQGLSLHTELSYEFPFMDTITDLIPGASFYEREVFEMLGVRFSDSQQNQPLLLPDDWDGQHFPLRAKEKETKKQGEQ